MYETNPFPFSPDDFTVTAVEPWFKVKVQVIQEYLQAFTSQMIGRADEIIFIDLFAGSGYYSSGFQKQIIPMPALQSLAVDPPFTKFIFCEREQAEIKALKIRVNKYFRGRNVVLFEDEPSALLEKLPFYVPPTKKNYKVATLCLIDPFSLDVPFALIQKLAANGYSFLIPYTFQLNSRCDFKHYVNDEAEKVKRFLGHNESAVLLSKSNTEFYKKLVRIHQNNMLTLGLTVSLAAQKVESKLMDIPMFYVGLFSKQIAVQSIAKEIKENNHQQFRLF